MDSDTCESLRKDERFSECVNKAIKATARFQAEDVVALEDVCVFVDPVDGTREFVEGRLENCQCLVGFCEWTSRGRGNWLAVSKRLERVRGG